MDLQQLWVITQQVVDLLWKAGVFVLSLVLSKRLWSAIKQWHEVQSARLKAERDIERREREAADRTVKRYQQTLEAAEKDATIHKSLAAGLEKEIETERLKFKQQERLSKRDEATALEVWNLLTNVFFAEGKLAQFKAAEVLTIKETRDFLQKQGDDTLTGRMLAAADQGLEVVDKAGQMQAETIRNLLRIAVERARALAETIAKGEENTFLAICRNLAGLRLLQTTARDAERVGVEVPLMRQYLFPDGLPEPEPGT